MLAMDVERMLIVVPSHEDVFDVQPNSAADRDRKNLQL